MKLDDWIKARGLRQIEVAAEIGITRSALNNLVSGRRSPSGRLAFRIEHVTKGKVRLADFYSTEGVRR